MKPPAPLRCRFCGEFALLCDRKRGCIGKRLRKYVVHKDQPHDVYVGRWNGGKWGNPFGSYETGSRSAAIAAYTAWIHAPAQAGLRNQMKLELKGKILGCHCGAGVPCHGEVIARIANGWEDE